MHKIIKIALVSLLMAALSEKALALPTAGAPIMPCKDIEKGMKGIGYTTFSGVEPEPFDVEIVGINYDFMGPGQHIIVALLHGEKIEFTGVIAGMSGSPVYINEKIVGAVSLSFTPFGKEVLVGITPMESMVYGAFSNGSALSNDKAVKPIELINVTLAKTLLFDAKEKTKNINKIIPGGPIAALVADGDISMAAIGTVTDIRDGIVYAFGHQFNRSGHTELGLAAAEIVRVVSSYEQSYKMGNVGPVIGTIYEDRASGIMGKIGPLPNSVPLEITLKTPAFSENYRFNVARDKEMTPMYIYKSIYQLLAAGIDYNKWGSFEIMGEIEIPGHGVLKVEDYLSDNTSMLHLMAAKKVAMMANNLWNPPIGEPALGKIKVQYNYSEKAKSKVIEALYTDKTMVKRGETLRLKASYWLSDGKREFLEYSLKIPPYTPKGKLTVAIGGASEAALIEETISSGLKFTTLENYYKFLKNIRTDGAFYTQLIVSAPTAQMGTKREYNLPPNYVLLAKGAADESDGISAKTIILEQKEAAHAAVSGAALVEIRVY